jgi:hypothetical protein
MFSEVSLDAPEISEGRRIRFLVYDNPGAEPRIVENKYSIEVVVNNDWAIKLRNAGRDLFPVDTGPSFP